MVKLAQYLYELPREVIVFINKYGLRTFWIELMKLLTRPETDSFEKMPGTCKKLMQKYLRGRGIAFGHCQEHLALLKNVAVDYAGEAVRDMSSGKNIEIDKPEKADDDHYDFIMCDQRFNPESKRIKAFDNWVRVLKPGGMICLVYHDIENALDHEGRQTKAIKRNFHGKNENIFKNTAFKKENKEKIASYFQSRNISVKILYFTTYLNNNFKECLIIMERTNYLPKIIEVLGKREVRGIADNHTLDVIVPIYNAYEDLEKCFYSLVKHQDIYRIFLIDDCSTDERVKELFDRIKEFKSGSFIIVENKNNMGYLKTANKAMSMTENDIILINSDTIVTCGWAGKMRDCAYSDKNIATVTPFTNNGGICSFPEINQGNDIPEGLTLDRFAKHIENSSERRYPEIPSAVGFCFFIKRGVINEIGYFDEVNFENGYGEEDDFSMRAARKGYKNVLCDDTYIYHKGCSSFSNRRGRLMKKNHRVLARRYPDYFPALDKFIDERPFKEFHEKIMVNMAENNLPLLK